MIPLRLELKNFMSYGDPPAALDLSGMHTLCLSGENGNGKSALLDAITWSLWGESRAGKNKHDDLVRIGADEMSVQFTFAMDGLIYRVLRKRSKRASGNQWELQQETPDQGLGAGWRSLTGNVAGETEKAIQKLLRMSYDTFLNSAYLRQGQADQFVRQTPGKRKEILADILDLSRYDQLEAKARERAVEAKAEATDLERDIHQMDAELSGEDAHRDALAILETRKDELHQHQETLRLEWAALRDRQGELSRQKESADFLKSQRDALDKELSELLHDLRDDQAKLDALRALLARRDDIRRDHDALLAARRADDDLRESVARWHKGQVLLADARRDWQAAENEVRARATAAARDHDQAAQRLQELPRLQAEHAHLHPLVAAADQAQDERGSLRAERETLDAEFHTLRETAAGLEVSLRQWTERLDALAQQRGVCEVCDSPLGPDRVESVRQGYETQLAQTQAERKTVRAQAAILKDQITALQKREAQLDADIKAAQSHRIKLGQLEQQLLALDAVAKDLPNLDALRHSTARTLDDQAFAPDIHVRIEDYQARLSKLEGVESLAADAKVKLTLLADAERRYVELQHAETTLAETEARHARALKLQTQREDALRTVQAQLAAMPDVTAELSRNELRTEQVVVEGKNKRQEENAAIAEIGSRHNALKRLSGLRVLRAEKEKLLIHAQSDHEVHDQLTKAFGKKGVQALIIENAIPELQEEANRLLERLTDGDMSLYFETLRESKTRRSDAPIETLDIKVSDSLGTRPLEMYSGGEGFKAAFALRIALSKLLARRAGARLQTLIIDEGFGTQDGKGREKLVDSLNAIGGDFEKIIVITHIDELKDAFPTRVEVVKTPMGSHITVLEGSAG